jgi:hypothetical protein
MGSLSVLPPPSLNREVPKSFGTNNWHSLGKGEKVIMNEKSGKILELLSSGKGEHFWQKVL